jgi:hypothetical protein
MIAMKGYLEGIPFLFLLLLYMACENQDKPEQSKLHAVPKEVRGFSNDSSSIIHPVPIRIPLLTTIPVKQFDSLVLEPNRESILAINRIDRKFLGRLDSVVIPDSQAADLNYYSPFPGLLKSALQIPDLIFVAYRIQAFAAYDSGRLVRWGPVSMGKRTTPTPTGLFYTNWKAKKTVSTENPEWILPWYFNIDNYRGVSFHEYDLPGFPASHACIRMRSQDARWLYSWARQWQLDNQGRISRYGTPVIIFGNYDFNQKAPWKFQDAYQGRALEKEVLLDSLIRKFISS